MTTAGDEKLKIATFKLPAEDWRRLEEIAQLDDRSVSAVMRLAVRRYLDAHDRRAAA